jgi:aspartate/methionine/tyrosine aminotransferase
MLIVNSPNNPSGAVIDDEEFVRIAELCRKNDIWVLSDECYSKFLYDGRRPFSIASHPEFKGNVVIAGSLSKTYAMTGWRIGYVLGPREVVGAVQKLQSHSTSNPVSVSQKAALEAVTGPQDSVGQMLGEYAKRRRFVVDRLRAIPGVHCAEPGGAFYAYPNISTSFTRGIRDTMDFSVKLLEKAHVAVVPGEAFGTKEHIRISYATSMELLEKGLTRIAEFMGNCDANLSPDGRGCAAKAGEGYNQRSFVVLTPALRHPPRRERDCPKNFPVREETGTELNSFHSKPSESPAPRIHIHFQPMMRNRVPARPCLASAAKFTKH